MNNEHPRDTIIVDLRVDQFTRLYKRPPTITRKRIAELANEHRGYSSSNEDMEACLEAMLEEEGKTP